MHTSPNFQFSDIEAGGREGEQQGGVEGGQQGGREGGQQETEDSFFCHRDQRWSQGMEKGLCFYQMILNNPQSLIPNTTTKTKYTIPNPKYNLSDFQTLLYRTVCLCCS